MGIHVYNPIEDSRVPFLRGILTRSLRGAGLTFSEAYEIANEVRNRLDSDAEIDTQELTDLVVKLLRKRDRDEVVERYLQGPQVPLSTVVRCRDGRVAPFSRSHLMLSLERCGLPADECVLITTAVVEHLLAGERRDVTSRELARLVHAQLSERHPGTMARRYLVWLEFFLNQRPLIVLVGGTTGAGKSTVCTEVAHRLGIVRIQSTDMLREVMRVMVPPRLLPALHASSFTAWKTLPSTEENPLDSRQHFLDGYLTQARGVGVAIEGVLRRAEREQLTLILEGVHVFPSLQRQLETAIDALVVPMLLVVPKRKQLRQHIEGRGTLVSKRRAERYLEHFDAIWELQTFLLSEAERHSVPIVPNVDEAESVRLFMEAISERLAEIYAGDPATVLD